MFDGDLTSLSTADLLESAADHGVEENRCAARRLEHAQVYADRHHPSNCPSRPGRRSWEGRERSVVLGGDGCPEIAEFAVAEFGVMLGISARVAADYIGQALALRHRFPFTWARVLAGEATPWRACRLTTACLKLSEEAARYVDQRVAAIIDTITPYRLDKIIKAARFHADPDGARAEAEEKARERGVFIGRTNEHGTKTIYIRTGAGAATRFDATIAAIAEAQKTFGDTRNVDHRRADAVGIIADHRFTEELLQQARNQHPQDTTPQHTEPNIAAPAGAQTNSSPGNNPATRDRANGEPAEPAMSSNGVAPGNKSADPGGQARPATGPAQPPTPSPTPTATPTPTPTQTPGPTPTPTRTPGSASASGAWSTPAAGSGFDDDLLTGWAGAWCEPGPDDEADRDAPHPSDTSETDPLEAPFSEPVNPAWPEPHTAAEPDEPLTPDAQRALHARLAAIKHKAHTNPTTRAGTDRPGERLRPGKTEIYVHLTDHTLATGTGVLRAEGIGPLLASQLAELIGHGPYVVKPVIDLNDAISVDAYEIPDRIRERVKLTHPVELFPYGNRETNRTSDLDHIQPYDTLGPPAQTSTSNLAPLGRFAHRVKTHARGWNVRRVDHKTLEWTTPHGFTFHVDPTGTHRVAAPGRPPDLS